MSVQLWTSVESVLDRYGVKPIVAVVPNNADPQLIRADHDKYFWNKVRGWEEKGWTIAMHGYTHVNEKNVNSECGSEFAGLSLAVQRRRIANAIEIFKEHRIKPLVWVAPRHSFDQVTLRALELETDLRIISDGIALDTFYANGFYWIPQQIWRLRQMQFGLWTVCLHPNEMDCSAIERLESSIDRYRAQLCDMAQITLCKRSVNVIEGMMRWAWPILQKAKHGKICLGG